MSVTGESFTDDEFHAYGLIASGNWQGIPDVNSPQVRKLVDWGFVTFHPDRPHTPIALDPKDVAQRRLKDMLEEAQARVARMSALPAVTDQLSVLYERAQWRAGAGSEWIEDAAVVNARLDDVVAGAEWEILAAQPGGPRTRGQLERSLERDTAALDRGVCKRTLYRATVRDNATTAEYARAMANRPEGKSAEFRTLPAPFERAIIVDRKVAVISNHLINGAPDSAAWVITDRAMVAYIAAEFDAKWRRAEVWLGELRSRGAGSAWDTLSSVDGIRTTRRQREILRDAVQGRDQRQTAQRLGIGVRTLQKEIETLKAMAGVSSLTGLGFWWGRCPDRLVDDDNTPDDATTGEPGA